MTVYQILIALLTVVSAALIKQPQIDYPRSRQVIQGVVVITGSSDIDHFHSAEISFAYASEQTSAPSDWFLIQTSFTPVENDTLAIWDTSTIADGDYDLRLLIRLDQGDTIEAVVRSLRVRNYLPVETDVPEILEMDQQLALTPTSTEIVRKATPTALLPNELALSANDFRNLVFWGLGIGSGSVLLVLLYGFIRKRI